MPPDDESPEHLERLRDQPEIKVALLRLHVTLETREVRFERTPKNGAYWPPVDALASRIVSAGRPDEVRDCIEVYERPCWLLATALGPSPESPYAIAVAAADGAAVDELVELLRSVCRDYWYGSAFFK